MVDPGVHIVGGNVYMHWELTLHARGKLQCVGSRHIGSKRLDCLAWHDGRIGKRILKVERAGGGTGYRVLDRSDAIENLLVNHLVGRDVCEIYPGPSADH